MSELIPLNKRRINVVNIGGKNFSMESVASNRADLEKEISALGMNVDFKGKKVIIGETKNTVDVPSSLLPASNFTLFVMPQKTKAGGVTRAYVKELMQKFPVEAKAHFSADKSYTVKKDIELNALLSSWQEPTVAAEIPASGKKEKKSSAGKKPKEMPEDNDIGDSGVEEHKMKEESGRDTGNYTYETLKAIHSIVVDNSIKLDKLLKFAGNSLAYTTDMKKAEPNLISTSVAYAEPVHELEEDDYNRVRREIEREFSDVKS